MSYENVKRAVQKLKDCLVAIDGKKANRSHDFILKQNITDNKLLQCADIQEIYTDHVIEATKNIACILSDAFNSAFGPLIYLVTDEASGISTSHVSLDNNLTFLDSERKGAHIIGDTTYQSAKAMDAFLDVLLNDEEAKSLLSNLPSTIDLHKMKLFISREIRVYEARQDSKSRTSSNVTPIDDWDSDDDDDYDGSNPNDSPPALR
jgi:hypothetical protein